MELGGDFYSSKGTGHVTLHKRSKRRTSLECPQGRCLRTMHPTDIEPLINTFAADMTDACAVLRKARMGQAKKDAEKISKDKKDDCARIGVSCSSRWVASASKVTNVIGTSAT